MKVTVSKTVDGALTDDACFKLVDDKNNILVFPYKVKAIEILRDLGYTEGEMKTGMLFHYECENIEEAEETIHSAADDFADFIESGRKIDFSVDYDEWLNCIRAAQKCLADNS
jgi:hypothetical protein